METTRVEAKKLCSSRQTLALQENREGASEEESGFEEYRDPGKSKKYKKLLDAGAIPSQNIFWT